MKVTVVCVGKLKEKYWRDAIAEYSKRLSRYMKLEIIELADEKAPENMSDAQAAEVKEREGQAKKSVGGVSHIVFIIGGSLGLSPAVMRRADYALSFSRMTFPHQMMRVVLLEQIYRSERIQRN